MVEESNGAERDQTADTNPSASRRRPRRLLRLGIIIVSIVLVLGLLLSFAPRYVARYLVSSELDRLGIGYDGVDTLDINPWTGEAWLGPVHFGVGPSGRGELGELGLKMRFNPLVKRRVSVERLLARGIDLVVTRAEDRALTVNGIPLAQVIPPPTASEQPSDEDDAWGAGADTLELGNSRLIFQDRERGDLEVEVERLVLTGFETWSPERPGRFELAAKVNDIQLNWSGEARPFADNITFTIDSRTENADVPKVVRFIGPLNLDRQEGTYDAQLKYDVTLFDSGRIEGHTVGTIDIKDADYHRAGVFALALESAKVDLDVQYVWSESGDLTLMGQVATDLGRASGGLGEDIRFGAAAGRVAVVDLDTAYGRDGALSVGARPEIDLESVEFSGPIEISADKLLEILALLQSLSAGGEISPADTGLGDYSQTSLAVPTSEVKIARLRSKGEALSLQSTEGRVELGLQTNSDLFDIRIVVDERTISIERLQSVLERLTVKSGQGSLTLDMIGGNSLVTAASVSPIGELKIGAFESRMEKFGLQTQTGAVSLQLAAASQLNGLSALLFAQGKRPQAQFDLGAASASLSQASLDAEGGALRWRVAGGATVDSLSAEFAKGKEGAFKFGRAEIVALQADERLQLAADALTIDGLDLYTKRSLLQALLQDGETGAGKAELGEELAATSTTTPEPVAEEVDVSRLQALLSELGYAPGPADGRMGQHTAAAIREFQRREGLAVDGRPTPRLLSALESRASGATDSKVAPGAGADVAKQLGPAVRLELFALTGNPVLRFRDDLVKPEVKIDAVFKEFRVQGLDTGKADQRANLNLIADVNEFTHVELTGWVAGLGSTADLDLAAKLDNLQLSTYSPYVAELGGVYLESGQLDAATAAKAKQGVLQGEIQLELDDIEFRPLSKEDAERLSAKVGVPLETAVNLLQDGEGRISLTLPVSGPLQKPEVDISSAVSKAIGGALKKVFPPTMVASMVAGAAKGIGPSFQPIEFAPGSAELDDNGKRYADGVMKLLAERPKLSLKICGRSTAQDRTQFISNAGAAAPPAAGDKGSAGAPADKQGGGPAETAPAPESAEVEQALVELAVARNRAVLRYLIEEQGVDEKQVPECRSTFDAADQGSPRVEISL